MCRISASMHASIINISMYQQLSILLHILSHWWCEFCLWINYVNHAHCWTHHWYDYDFRIYLFSPHICLKSLIFCWISPECFKCFNINSLSLCPLKPFCFCDRCFSDGSALLVKPEAWELFPVSSFSSHSQLIVSVGLRDSPSLIFYNRRLRLWSVLLLWL